MAAVRRSLPTTLAKDSRTRILRTRIDRFGWSPVCNADKETNLVNEELYYVQLNKTRATRFWPRKYRSHKFGATEAKPPIMTVARIMPLNDGPPSKDWGFDTEVHRILSTSSNFVVISAVRHKYIIELRKVIACVTKIFSLKMKLLRDSLGYK